jgi:hypothetical protein
VRQEIHDGWAGKPASFARPSRLRAGVAALALLAGALAAGRAEAGDASRLDVINAATKVITSVNGRIDNMSDQVSGAIQTMSTTLSGELQRQNEAAGKIADAQEVIELERQRDLIRAGNAKKFDVPASACYAVTASATMQGTNRARGGARAAFKGSRQAWAKSGQNAMELVKGHENIGEWLKSQDLENKHIDLELVIADEYITIEGGADSPPRKAAQALLNNATMPFPMRELTDAELATEAGKILKQKQDLLMLKAEIGASAFDQALADRYEVAGLGTMAKGILQSAGQPANLPENISFEQLMKSLVVDLRFANPNWFAQLQTMGEPTTLLREIASMQALSLYLDWERYKLERATALVQAKGYLDQHVIPEASDLIPAGGATASAGGGAG